MMMFLMTLAQAGQGVDEPDEPVASIDPTPESATPIGPTDAAALVEAATDSAVRQTGQAVQFAARALARHVTVLPIELVMSSVEDAWNGVTVERDVTGPRGPWRKRRARRRRRP